MSLTFCSFVKITRKLVNSLQFLLKQCQQNYSEFQLVHSIKMKLSIEELKVVADIRGIKRYRTMSKDELLRSLSPSKTVKNQKQILLKKE